MHELLIRKLYFCASSLVTLVRGAHAHGQPPLEF
eukprot:COSAG01_NODE_44131_length_422_cov_0.931889_1_plen_33_part_01